MGSKMYLKKCYFFKTSQHKTQFSRDQKLDSWRWSTILVNLDFNIKKPYDSHHGNQLQAFQFIGKIVGNHIPQLPIQVVDVGLKTWTKMVRVIQIFPKKSINPQKKRKRNHIMSTNKEQLQDIHLENDWQVLGGF